MNDEALDHPVNEAVVYEIEFSENAAGQEIYRHIIITRWEVVPAP